MLLQLKPGAQIFCAGVVPVVGFVAVLGAVLIGVVCGKEIGALPMGAAYMPSGVLNGVLVCGTAE